MRNDLVLKAIFNLLRRYIKREMKLCVACGVKVVGGLGEFVGLVLLKEAQGFKSAVGAAVFEGPKGRGGESANTVKGEAEKVMVIGWPEVYFWFCRCGLMPDYPNVVQGANEGRRRG